MVSDHEQSVQSHFPMSSYFYYFQAYHNIIWHKRISCEYPLFQAFLCKWNLTRHSLYQCMCIHILEVVWCLGNPARDFYFSLSISLLPMWQSGGNIDQDNKYNAGQRKQDSQYNGPPNGKPKLDSPGIEHRQSWFQEQWTSSMVLKVGRISSCKQRVPKPGGPVC